MGQLLNHALKQAEGVPLRLENIEGQPVTITAVEFSSGSFGAYLTMTVVDTDDEALDIMTGAKLVVDAVENAVEDGDLPCEAKFVRRGRTWLIESTEVDA